MAQSGVSGIGHHPSLEPGGGGGGGGQVIWLFFKAFGRSSLAHPWFESESTRLHAFMHPHLHTEKTTIWCASTVLRTGGLGVNTDMFSALMALRLVRKWV